MGQRAGSDRLFEDYLRYHHIAVLDREPDSRAEYLVEVDRQTCLCGIQELVQDAGETGALDPSSATGGLEPVRSKLHEGARQLCSSADRGRPLVLVVANPSDAPVILKDGAVMWALEGAPVTENPARSGSGPRHAIGDNGEVRQDHPHLTALAVIHERVAEPETPFAHAFIPNSDAAVPLPPGLFRGPHDRIWEYSLERRAYVVVRDHGIGARRSSLSQR
jgi:hypothetical protein